MNTFIYVIVVMIIMGMIWRAVKGVVRFLLMGVGLLFILAVLFGGGMGITVDKDKVGDLRDIVVEYAGKVSEGVKVEGMDVKIRVGLGGGDWLSLGDIVDAVRGPDGAVRVYLADGKEYLVSDADALGILKRLYALVEKK